MASNYLLCRLITTTAASCTSTANTARRPVYLASATAATSSVRGYVTRAHPSPTPTSPIHNAIQTLLDEMELRRQHRLERWEKYKDKRVEQRVEYLSKHGKPGSPSAETIRSDAASQPYRPMDETVELALQLNLDPRKPGQSLRGSLSLPHGNGKNFAVAVFTEDARLAELALQRGAVAAGGMSLIESIQGGKTPISSFQRTLASPEMVSQLSSIARLLGPRGLMPSPKLNTIIPTDQLLDALAKQMSGTSNYRTDKDGIIRLGIGKGSFGADKLLDNVRELMNEVHSLKPETFGKGKKGQKKVAKGTKYYLKAHLSATQSAGSFLVDLRTLDPTSPFFMIEPQ